jgi:hypothetical protein
VKTDNWVISITYVFAVRRPEDEEKMTDDRRINSLKPSELLLYCFAAMETRTHPLPEPFASNIEELRPKPGEGPVAVALFYLFMCPMNLLASLVAALRDGEFGTAGHPSPVPSHKGRGGRKGFGRRFTF